LQSARPAAKAVSLGAFRRLEHFPVTLKSSIWA
jgi:hypothetical protein